MKKLFFTALVAVVAVGGAVAQTYYPIGSSQPTYLCPEGQLTCDIKYGADPLVSPTPAPNQPIQFRLSTVAWDGVN